MTKTTKLVWIVVGTIVILSGILAFPSPVHEQTNEKITSQTKKEDRLDQYLSALETLECRDCAPGYKRIDSNGKYSYGCLQFQLRTFMSEYKKYFDTKGVPDYIIAARIDSCEDQKAVARRMFEDNPVRASHHWYTSIYKRGLGLP